MAKYYDLNKLRLEADEDGFTLRVPVPDNGIEVSVSGWFDTPEAISGYKLLESVVESYRDQVEEIETKGMVDASSERGALVLDARFTLKPGTNWFELDHTVFNEVYIS